MADIVASRLRESLKRAWADCYYKLIPKDAENRSEELEVYQAWIEWFDAGQMQTNPMFNIALGYVIADRGIDKDISGSDMKEAQELFLLEGRKALEELVEELQDE